MKHHQRTNAGDEAGKDARNQSQCSTSKLPMILRLRLYLLELLFGPPLASDTQPQHKLGFFTGIPTFGLDGLSSCAYGPEAALAVLSGAGAAYIQPVMWIVLALLAVLYISYLQTIRAYPNAAGSYVVAKENLGANMGLLAAAALMIDYILNVAVGISAGVAALVSAVPGLRPHILMLCLIVLAVISMANLRGTKEAGRLFAIPTYLFIATMVSILGIGILRIVTGSGHLQPIVPPFRLAASTSLVGSWLFIKAFASGCTAMTGVEAVSNGISAFREPRVKHAHRTLTAVVLILAALIMGIAYLAHAYGISAMDQGKPGYQSLLSQLAGAVIGRGIFYYITISAVLAVLILSANTSFADLPRLCSFVAKDKYLPDTFAELGRRLVFSVGIAFLTSTAGLLLIVFDGITDRLIPLFAVGAFMAFTLSQAGMVSHWLKKHRGSEELTSLQWIQSRSRMLLNGVGAVATGVALLVILVAKFSEGAWIVVIAIPSLIMLFKIIRAHYTRLEWQIRPSSSLAFKRTDPPLVLLPIQDWNSLAAKAMSFALRLSSDVTALHINPAGGAKAKSAHKSLRARWELDVESAALKMGIRSPKLICVQSRYRRLVEPILQYVAELKEESGNRLIAVVIPELIKVHWWEHLLHNHRALRLRHTLLKYGGPRLIVVSVPWYMDDPVDLKEIATAEDGGDLKD